jgi:predicted short-subunit dehydrogenase-like oxidoreductase (DUF2520 family)
MKLLSACLILCLTGCATLDKDVAPKAAAAVMTYCATPQAERLLIRESVNSRITPNSIVIHCQGDTP